MSAPAVQLTPHDVIAASERIAGHVRITPMMSVDSPVGPIMLKLECLQQTGSFKARGAVNSMLQSRADSFIACSGGNHGLAVAWAARRLGRRATVVVPLSAAANKVEAMRRAGAEVIQHGDTPGEAFEVADQLVVERGWPLVHPFDQGPTIAGQGTCGLELHEQAAEVTHWLIAIGGGGFAAGVRLGLDACGAAATVVPVEPRGCPTLAIAQATGRPTTAPAQGVARTSLGAPVLGDLAWDILRSGPSSVLVSDEAIAESQRWLWQEVRVATEPGGACALAALLSEQWTRPDGAVVGVVVCGANTDNLPG